MEAGRTSYLCGIVLGFALGFAAAHLAFSSRHAPVADEAPAEPARLTDEIARASGGLIVSGEPQPSGHTVVALAEVPAEVNTEPVAEPPKELPHPNDAAPLAVRAAKEDGILKEMIRQELDTFAASDRDVWYEALRDMPPSDATSILQIWKMMRPIRPSSQQSVVPPHAEHLAPPSVPVSVKMAPESEPTGKPDAPLDHHFYNLLNVETPGFKRWEPMIVEGSAPSFPDARNRPLEKSHPQLIAMRLDMTQGQLCRTDRPFDLAIEGEGFFPLKVGEKTCYSRCGRFSLDNSRRLVLLTSDGQVATLLPDVIVPERCQKLTVSEHGMVRAAVADQPEPADLGKIFLYRFLDATALRPVGGGLFEETADSGAAWTGGANEPTGLLRQGHFEQSNVDRHAELARLERLRKPKSATAATEASAAH